MFFDLNDMGQRATNELFWQDGQLILADSFDRLTASVLFHLHTKQTLFPFRWGILQLKTEIVLNKVIVTELGLIMPNGQIITHLNVAEKLTLELPSPVEAPEDFYIVNLVCSRAEEFTGCQKSATVNYKQWKPQLKLKLEESWQDAIALLKVRKQKNIQLGTHWAEDPDFIPALLILTLNDDKIATVAGKKLWCRLRDLYKKVKSSIEKFPYSKDIESRLKYQALHLSLAELEPYFGLPAEPYVEKIGFPPYCFYAACLRMSRILQGVLGIPKQKGEVTAYNYNHHDLFLTFAPLCQNLELLIERVASLTYREEEFVCVAENSFEAEAEPADKYVLIVDNDMNQDEVENWVTTAKTAFLEEAENIDIKGSSFGLQWERRKNLDGVSPSYRHVYLLKNGNSIVAHDRKCKLIIKGARSPIPRELNLLFELKA